MPNNAAMGDYSAALEPSAEGIEILTLVSPMAPEPQASQSRPHAGRTLLQAPLRQR